MDKYIEDLLKESDKLHAKYELSKTISAEYFEPGMMEYLDQYDGVYDCASKKLTVKFEVKGTRYEGRTEFIENMKQGDEITVIRDNKNPYNSNNFAFLNSKGNNVGNMPAELCDAMAPLYDCNTLSITRAIVSYVQPITARSRYAKQAILFVELECEIK